MRPGFGRTTSSPPPASSTTRPPRSSTSATSTPRSRPTSATSPWTRRRRTPARCAGSSSALATVPGRRSRRRRFPDDGIAPNRQLAADANGEALWLSETSAAGPGGPSGVVATWLRRTGGMGTPLRLAVSRLDGTSWETPKIYDGSFTSATVSATSAGAVLLAGGRDEEIWGTQVGSISAPWPGSLERLSPQTDG